jgi:hypothetical protein
MPDGIFKKTELIANIAIIIVALLLGGVLIKRFLLPGNETTSARSIDPHIPPERKPLCRAWIGPRTGRRC